MTGLDWGIVAFALLLAWIGYRQGFIVGVLSFAGFAVGAFVGTRVGPLLLPHGSASPYAPAFGLLGALLAGAILASGLEGVGLRLRRVISMPGLGVLDGALGALLSAAVALGVVWIIAAVAAEIPGQNGLREAIQSSTILTALNRALPPSGSILGDLARLDPLPALSGPAPKVGAPPSARIAHDPDVETASASVVRVLGTACGLAIEGSGWVVAPDEVVTNAHVVAGEQDTTVQPAGGPTTIPATPIAFNPTVDLAVLHVPNLGLKPLHLVVEPSEGSAGAILGYPEDGPFNVEAARIGRTQNVISDNAYGEGPVMRLLTPLRGLVRPGNSGGPIVNGEGRVLTTVFASTTGGGPVGGYGVANRTVSEVVAKAGAEVGTGHCADG